jgi:hypothetical protein
MQFDVRGARYRSREHGEVSEFVKPVPAVFCRLSGAVPAKRLIFPDFFFLPVPIMTRRRA